VEPPSNPLPDQNTHPCSKEGEEDKQQGQPTKNVQKESPCWSWEQQEKGGESDPEPGEGGTLHSALETRVVVHPALKSCHGFNASPTQQQGSHEYY
jgi:hypothetical protein